MTPASVLRIAHPKRGRRRRAPAAPPATRQHPCLAKLARLLEEQPNGATVIRRPDRFQARRARMGKGAYPRSRRTVLRSSQIDVCETADGNGNHRGTDRQLRTPTRSRDVTKGIAQQHQRAEGATNAGRRRLSGRSRPPRLTASFSQSLDSRTARRPTTPAMVSETGLLIDPRADDRPFRCARRHGSARAPPSLVTVPESETLTRAS